MSLRSRFGGLSFLIKMVIVLSWLISLCLSSFNAFSEIRDLRTKQYMQVEGRREMGNGGMARRKMIGPGSHPPKCMYKCGNCSPCWPVHVAVPPRSHVIMEYYPEAWRCKCGNRLYMP